MKCNHCGASLRPTAKLCIQCGKTVGAAPETVAAPPPSVDGATPATPIPSSSQTSDKEAVPLSSATATAAVLDEPAPPAPGQAAMQMPKEHPSRVMAAAPEIVSGPNVQKKAKYEVAPEYATPPAIANSAPAAAITSSAKQSPTASKNGIKMAMGGLALLTAGAVAYLTLAGGNKAPETPTDPVPAQVAAPAPAPAQAAAAARTVDKAFINEMLQLAGQDQWSALADMVSNTQTQANPDGQVLRDQAQAALSSRNNAQAQKLTLELLLTDPQSGSAWLLASQVFAAQESTQPAQSALKLAYYFAKDRAQALGSLTEFARTAEAQFKAVVKQAAPLLSAIPARNP